MRYFEGFRRRSLILMHTRFKRTDLHGLHAICGRNRGQQKRGDLQLLAVDN